METAVTGELGFKPRVPGGGHLGMKDCGRCYVSLPAQSLRVSLSKGLKAMRNNNTQQPHLQG